LAQIQAVPAQSFADFEAEDDNVDIANDLWATSIAHCGGGIRAEGVYFSAVVVGRVSHCGRGRYGLGVHTERLALTYTHRYIYIHIFREYKFYFMNVLLQVFGTPSSRVFCICIFALRVADTEAREGRV